MAMTYALSIDQGATFSETIKVTGKDFTGCTGKCQIRKKASLDSVVIAEPLVTCNSDDTLVLDLTATQTGSINLTSTIPTTADTLYYDVFITQPTPSTVVNKEITGTVTIYPSITRA